MLDWQIGVLLMLIGLIFLFSFWDGIKKKDKNAPEWIKISLSYDLIILLVGGIILFLSGLYKIIIFVL